MNSTRTGLIETNQTVFYEKSVVTNTSVLEWKFSELAHHESHWRSRGTQYGVQSQAQGDEVRDYTHSEKTKHTGTTATVWERSFDGISPGATVSTRTTTNNFQVEAATKQDRVADYHSTTWNAAGIISQTSEGYQYHTSEVIQHGNQTSTTVNVTDAQPTWLSARVNNKGGNNK